MSWSDARVFLVVAEEMSFSRAAARLGRSQPAVSQRVARLERRLRTRLVWRTTRRVGTTEAGGSVRRAVADIDDVWDRARPLPGAADRRPPDDRARLFDLLDEHDAALLLAVAEEGSLARAGRLFHLAGPAVSARVRKVEARFAVELFRRSPAGVRPTAAGEVLIGVLRDAVLRWDQLLCSLERGDPEVRSPDAGGAGADAGGGAPAGRPAQLPAAVAAFTGRESQLARLDRVMAGGADAVVISAIDGTAGVGKTALAVHWAQRVRDRFPDGQLHVDLHGYSSRPATSPLQALAGILRALGVPTGEVPLQLDEATALYRSLLADRRVLVLLDNAADVHQVRPLLPGGRRCLVLVTSRDRLSGLVARDGARRLNLAVLTPDESRRLLGSVLDDDRVAAEPAAVERLAEVCAHLPLALRIAAAHLAERPTLGVGAYVRELLDGDRLETLSADGDEGTAVRAAFALSYTRLAPEARRMLRLIGLAPTREVTVPTAGALAGTSTDHARRILHRLTVTHLVEERTPDPAGEARFACHDLLRVYAGQRSEQEDGAGARADALDRLFAHYLDAANRAADVLHPNLVRLGAGRGVPDPAPAPPTEEERTRATGWLRSELLDVLAIVEHTRTSGPRAVAWQLADAVRGHLYYCRSRVEWSAMGRAALAAAEAEGDALGEASARLSLGVFHEKEGDLVAAEQHLDRLLVLSRRVGWKAGEAAALINLGAVHRVDGQLSRAAARLTEALDTDFMATGVYRQTGLGQLGIVLLERGELVEAADVLGQALEAATRSDSRSLEAATRVILGEVYHALGRSGDARTMLEAALEPAEQVDNRVSLMEALALLAAVARDGDDTPRALDLARSAARLADDLDDDHLRALAHIVLGSVHDADGRHEQALGCYEDALRRARAVDARYAGLDALIGIAESHRRLGDTALSLVEADGARVSAHAFEYRVLEAQALTVLARAHLDGGDVAAARVTGSAAASLFADCGHRIGERRARAVLLGPAPAPPP